MEPLGYNYGNYGAYAQPPATAYPPASPQIPPGAYPPSQQPGMSAYYVPPTPPADYSSGTSGSDSGGGFSGGSNYSMESSFSSAPNNLWAQMDQATEKERSRNKQLFNTNQPQEVAYGVPVFPADEGDGDGGGGDG